MRSYADFGSAEAAERSAVPLADRTDQALAERLKRLLLEEVDLNELSRLEVTQRRVRLERVLAHLVSREGVILSTRERTSLVRRVVDESIGLGVLEPILADPSVSEIMINGHDTIYVERYGRLERIPSGFTSNDAAAADDRPHRVLGQPPGRRVEPDGRRAGPCRRRMPRGARVNVVLPPLSLNGPVVTIRLFPKAYGIDELLARGRSTSPRRRCSRACVRARLTVVVSGGTASGKTTMLNALSGVHPRPRSASSPSRTPPSSRSPRSTWCSWRPARPTSRARGQVSIRDLVRNALRMRPDRIIVGEVRGGEALDMLQAMNTGHEGSLTTVHANSSDDALTRMETLASMSESTSRSSALRDQVNSALDVVVQLQRAADGMRRIVQVDYLASRNREDYRLVPPGAPTTRTAVTSCAPRPRRPGLAQRLAQRGERMPDGFGEAVRHAL